MNTINNSVNLSKDIIGRLDELTKWHEQQEKVLLEKQNMQRELLMAEHRNKLEMFGLSGMKSGNSFDSNTFGDYKRENNSPSIKEQKMKNNHQEPPREIPKKPFLKRGEGLTNRFRVHPDSFKLDNLPKYKYAGRNKKLFHKTVSKSNTISEQENSAGPKRNDGEIKAKHLTWKLDEKSNGHDQNLVELPLKVNQNTMQGLGSFNLKVDNLIKEAKNKDSIETMLDELLTVKNKSAALQSELGSQPMEEASKLSEPVEPMSWAQVLDPKSPISIERIRGGSNNTSSIENSQDNQNTLNLFELLEQKAQEGSFNFDINVIKRWMNTTAIGLGDPNNDFDLSNVKDGKFRISPVPFDIDKEIDIDKSDESTESEEDCPRTEKGHVRFNDDVIVNKVDMDSDTASETSSTVVNTNATSTPNEKNQFEKFKSDLFPEEINSTVDESTLIDDKRLIEQERNAILQKSEMLKERLTDLENEIATFKRHNAELIKLKQDHELEKVHLEEEICEMKEKLNDEKIKIEIYLHDERIKLEEEKRKFEKLIKEQRQPNRKEREEIIRLKEQTESMQRENKEKDSKHIAAQARLRAQLRNLEKEVKDLNIERDCMKKEIKKLENENARLNRMNNNKMLQEINKTISKLSPKVEVAEVKNKDSKPLVAKVVSYRKLESTKTARSKSFPNLCKKKNYSTSEDESSASSSKDSKSDCEDSQYFSKRRSCPEGIRRQRRKLSDSISENKKDPEENFNKSKISNRHSGANAFKREIVNPDGSKDVWYPNGNLKKISSDGMIIRMLYFNKDVKETNINEGTVKYYYAESNTWHTTYLDGLEILEFPNGQTEHRYKDGSIEVHFPNGSIKISNPNDEQKAEEWRYPDGTTLIQMKSGDKVLSLANGQREIHTKLYKRREYPDGTVKVVYPDGSQETRYSTGRVRLKDKDGKLVMDSENFNC